MTPVSDLLALSDQEVVARALDGSERAYRELLRRYEKPVFSLIYRMVRDREKAEDLAQESFVKALNALASYRPEYKFSSWIFKIANNTAIDALRKREIDTTSLFGSGHAEGPRDGMLQIGDDAETPLAEVEARELGGIIEVAVARLRPEYRSCILLRYVEGLAYEEIAQALDLPLGTVKTYIHRARNELKDALEDLRQ